MDHKINKVITCRDTIYRAPIAINMTIKTAQLRQYQLYKQNILNPVDASKYQSILKSHIALHSTDYLTPYLSLWTRVKDFEPEELYKDLNITGKAFRLRGFRGTVFVVHHDNTEKIIGGASLYLKSTIPAGSKLFSEVNLDPEEFKEQVFQLVAKSPGISTREIKKTFGSEAQHPLFIHLLRHLEFKGQLMRGPQKHLLDNTIRYILPERMDIQDNSDTENHLRQLITDYIEQFGPVTLEDICWWFPLTKTVAKKYLSILEKDIASLAFEDKNYLMTNDDYQLFLNWNSNNIKINDLFLLPYEDHFPKAYKNRDWYDVQGETPKMFHVRGVEYGQLRPSIWYHGHIIGRWEIEWGTQKKSAKVSLVDITQKLKDDKKIQLKTMEKIEELEIFLNRKIIPLINDPKT